MAYMSTAPAGFFTVGCKDIAILFVKVRRKTQFCHNGDAWYKRLACCDLKIFFRKSDVLKPRQPRPK